MSKAGDCVFLLVESSLHVSAETSGGAIDRPLARDDATGHPIVPANSLRGSLIAAARRVSEREVMDWAFGTPPGSAEPRTGALAISRARPLLFPVRTLRGVFAWVTSPAVVATWQASVASAGVDGSKLPGVPGVGEGEAVRVAADCPSAIAGDKVVLEDLCFPAAVDDGVLTWGQWLADRAVLSDDAHAYWRRKLSRGIIVVPDSLFDFFVSHRAPLVRRVAIDRTTGTASEGAIWTTEVFPPETLFYAIVTAEQASVPPPVPTSAVRWLKSLGIVRFQVGAGRTCGNGFVSCVWLSTPGEKA